MEIVIAAGGMPFGPNTLAIKSLGGSETAALMLARELAKLKAVVSIFVIPPQPQQPDYFPHGHVDGHGVRWLYLDQYQHFVEHTEFDLLIASRDPRLVAVNAQARKKVLWCHDVATHRGLQAALDQMQWTFDEIWAVSEWHKDQIHEVTGYPKDSIRVVRNGIVPLFDDGSLPPLDHREPTTLLYAARPERGLEHLVKPGGIMERLPNFTLEVAMYGHYPPHMQDYYNMIFTQMRALPNVKFLGELTSAQLRLRMREVAAYVYPTQFPETSCLIARECIEQRTPFLCTSEGALPETLGECGVFFEDWLRTRGVAEPEKGSGAWCDLFARFVEEALANQPMLAGVQQEMSERADLYWPNVARDVLNHPVINPVTQYSRARSLMRDSDIIAAQSYLEHLEEQGKLDTYCGTLLDEIYEQYPFIKDETSPAYESLASYYSRFYSFKKPELKFDPEIGAQTERYAWFRQHISKLPPGAIVAEYGCGEGHVLGHLAKQFPDIKFIGFDQVQQNVDMVRDGCQRFDIKNLTVYRAEEPRDAEGTLRASNRWPDLVICSEVLEHVVKPWEVATGVERMCKRGGTILITTPYGAWEWKSLTKSADEFKWRNHIWHLDKPALREMFRGKANSHLTAFAAIHESDGRAKGQYGFSYTADHTPILELDPLAKAMRHNARQSCAAAIIAMNNGDTILKMLNSIADTVDHVRVALGPSPDHTAAILGEWADSHPWITVDVVDVPKIEVGKFGFDDARKESARGLEAFDWILWIDTDEYLSGNPRRYFRENCLDGYIVPQHHFTVNPRGQPAQVDRPARLIRPRAGFQPRGKVHEHFEIPAGGPGRCYILEDVDIGHPGYVNEDVRKARFFRNFPLLEWDHALNPDRKLGKYLWLRDIVHRMRHAFEHRDPHTGRSLAVEAEQYYNENFDDLTNYIGGSFLLTAYMAEVRRALGKGIPFRIVMQFEDATAPLEGVFTDADEPIRMLKKFADDEFKRRQSRYY